MAPQALGKCMVDEGLVLKPEVRRCCEGVDWTAQKADYI